MRSRRAHPPGFCVRSVPVALERNSSCFIALRAQASAAQRSEESRLSGKQADVTRGKAGISVEASLSKQSLKFIVAPSKKASSKNPTQKKSAELLVGFLEPKRGLVATL